MQVTVMIQGMMDRKEGGELRLGGGNREGEGGNGKGATGKGRRGRGQQDGGDREGGKGEGRRGKGGGISQRDMMKCLGEMR